MFDLYFKLRCKVDPFEFREIQDQPLAPVLQWLILNVGLKKVALLEMGEKCL